MSTRALSLGFERCRRAWRRSVAVSALLLLLPVASAGAGEPEVGSKAPPFSLTGSDGRTHTLAEHAGKRGVVLAWFPKAFTPG